VNKYGLAQIIGKNSIKKKNSFKVKICHFTNFVSLGIVDQNVQYIMPGKKNLIYYGNSKYFFNGEKDNENTGLGYTYDEIVEVVVDLNNG
jgi:nucleoside permease NupC